MTTALKFALPLYVAAALVAIWSFLPKRKLANFHRDPNQAKNLLYFAHIATFDTTAYRTRVRERYMPDDGPPITESFLDDLAVQIAVNSQIANRKFTLFNAGAALLLLAMLVLAAPMLRIGIKYVLVLAIGTV